MAQTDQREAGLLPGPSPDPGGTGRAPARGTGRESGRGTGRRRHLRGRVSSGHTVMVVAGLLAALLTYSVLRQAGAPGTVVLAAARPIRAGEDATASAFTTTTIKASAGAIAGMVTPATEGAILGKAALADIAPGQVIQAELFAAATPEPARMTLQVDQQAVPAGLRAGARIDLLGQSAGGQGVIVPGLLVLSVSPGASGTGSLAASPTTESIDVSVPDLTVGAQVYLVTSGKFLMRVSDPSPSAGPPSAASAGPPG